MTHYSYNEFHLGDSLIHMHFLRHLALENPGHKFVHHVHPCHISQLNEVIEDIFPAVRLWPLDGTEANNPEFRNVWKNAGATVTDGGPAPNYVPGFWEKHPLRNDYAGFYLAWFQYLAAEMGLKSPFNNREDLLFDYPKLQEKSNKGLLERCRGFNRYDFLVVNSQPSSGQLMAYNTTEYLTPLIEELAERYVVITTQPIKPTRPTLNIACTRDYNLSVSEIGILSNFTDHLIMVSTGPSWCTFNKFNQDSVKLRVLLLGNGERVDYARNLIQVPNREEARETLVAAKLL